MLPLSDPILKFKISNISSNVFPVPITHSPDIMYIQNFFFVFCIMAEMVPRSSGGDSASTVIKLDTVRRIAEKVSSKNQNSN